MLKEVINEYIDAKVKSGLIKEKCRECIAGAVHTPFDCHGRMFAVSFGSSPHCDYICKEEEQLEKEEYGRIMRDISYYIMANECRINEEAKKKQARFEAESKALMLASEKKGFLSRLFGL